MLPILKRDYISPETGQVFEVQTIGDSTHVLRNGWGVHVGQTSGDFREFVTRLLAEAAIAKGLAVLSSETHGMAQRGGTVLSHLKVGDFSSPLIRPGHADLSFGKFC